MLSNSRAGSNTGPFFFRRVPWAQGSASAYDIFSRDPERFTAILESPDGSGRQFLVSAEGETIAGDSAQILQQWRQSLEPITDAAANGAIRCLFYAAYEAGRLIENLPVPRTALPGPTLWLFYPAWSCCFDAEAAEVMMAARSEKQLDRIEAMLRPVELESVSSKRNIVLKKEIDESDAVAYQRAVLRVKQYIEAGDIFQANIARFWKAPYAATELAVLYARLRAVNPAPFSCFVRVGELTLVSSSPERLFRMRNDGVVDSRPIAGTRRRGDADQDHILCDELLLSEKERAEHIMLVDLERNDLGRVCRPGTVRVDEQMSIERYATVQHIVSNVSGRLAEGRDVVDLFAAMFPGGTITGCPKIRCMQIIHELEGRARGPYTGGVGYVAWDGCADMNILIRTFWHWQAELHWAAGAGIVADSDPEHELHETEHKAEGLLRALYS